jgi:transposase
MMNRDEISGLSKDELVDLILALYAQIEALRADNAALRADNQALKLKLEKLQKPPTNSGNSSQPPSQDYKANLSKKGWKKRHGPPKGHQKYERAWVAEPDHIVEVKVEKCAHCQTDLSTVEEQLVNVNQVTELPEAKAEVIEVRQYASECPCCGREQIGLAPAGLEMERRFGARLEATVVYYRQEQHMSYVRTQAALRNLHGVEISQGGIDKIMQRAGRKAQRAVEPITQALQESDVIYCDETGGRVAGDNWWQWVFASPKAVLHVFRFNRSVDVIQDVMDDNLVDVWISDCYAPQMKAPSQQHQLCLAHQIRNLQAVIEKHPKDFWARHVQRLFRYAIHLHHHRDELTSTGYRERVERIERCLDRLLAQGLDPPDACRLQRRYHKYRHALFVFLHREDVDPTNNLSERYLRPAVVHRKVLGGFRSGWGAKAYAALKSLIDSAALSSITPFEAIQNLHGTPALPLRV